MTKLGTEELEKALKVLIQTAMEIDEGLEDGKLNFIEYAGLADNVIGIIRSARNAKLIGQQAMDLDDEEKARLVTLFEEEFDIENDQLEETIETAWKALVYLSGIFEVIGKKEEE